MRIPNRKPLIPRDCLVAVGAATFLAILYVLVYIFAWRLHGFPMKLAAIDMRAVHKHWLSKGAVATQLTNYGSSTTSSSYYVFTNCYTIKGRTHQCQLAAKLRRLDGRGILAITEGGILIWIDNETGPEIVNP